MKSNFSYITTSNLLRSSLTGETSKTMTISPHGKEMYKKLRNTGGTYFKELDTNCFKYFFFQKDYGNSSLTAFLFLNKKWAAKSLPMLENISTYCLLVEFWQKWNGLKELPGFLISIIQWALSFLSLLSKQYTFTCSI